MSNARATELARLILDDLRGACYYADPKVLGGLLKSERATEQDMVGAGIGVLHYLLSKYVPRSPTEKDLQDLATMLHQAGVR